MLWFAKRSVEAAILFGFTVLAAHAQALAPQVELQPESAFTQSFQSVIDTQEVANLSYGLWQDGALLRAGYFGPQNDHSDTVVTDRTIHRIYSMTKPVTAVGMLILIERGAFELDDPITNILPEFAEIEVLADIDTDGHLYTYRPIRPPTIRQLLSHTAGFSAAQAHGNVFEQKLLETGIKQSPNNEAVIQAAATLPFASEPGAKWTYSIASDLQGAIIERVTGEDLNTFLTREIFEPLGMTDTGFFVASSNADRVSGVTERASNGLAYASHASSDHTTQSQRYYEGGSGLFSTQHDYYRFLSFLLGDGVLNGQRLLSADAVAQLRTNAIRFRGKPAPMDASGSTAGIGYGFGVGIIIDPTLAKMPAPKGTYFWSGALGTWFWVDPQHDIIFIGMIQSQSALQTDLMRLSMSLVFEHPDSRPDMH